MEQCTTPGIGMEKLTMRWNKSFWSNPYILEVSEAESPEFLKAKFEDLSDASCDCIALQVRKSISSMTPTIGRV
jgi:hypothetical protein